MMIAAMTPPLDAAGVRVSDDGAVRVLTLARPHALNAFDDAMVRALDRSLSAAEDDEAVRVVVLTGEGKAFSAGFDLAYAGRHPEVYRNPSFGAEIVRRPLRRKPLIAAVNGIAFGLGFELALACDLIVAAGDAQFALPEPTVGLAAIGGGVARLSRQIGFKPALGIALSARRVSAGEGQRLGFVNEVAEGPVVAAARAWADRIVRGAPLAIAATLEIAYRSIELPQLATALDPQRYPSIAAVLESEDAQEGRRAFMEKRAPVWRGR